MDVLSLCTTCEIYSQFTPGEIRASRDSKRNLAVNDTASKWLFSGEGRWAAKLTGWGDYTDSDTISAVVRKIYSGW